MLQVVVLLLCLLGPILPVGSSRDQDKKYFEVELPADDFDESASEWNQSPWLESSSSWEAPAAKDTISSVDEEDLDYHEMSPEEAAAILERVEAAAKQRAQLENAQEASGPSEVGYFTGTAYMGTGLDTASDAAAMQFLAVRSPAEEQQLFSLSAASPSLPLPSPAPAPIPTAVAPAPGDVRPEAAAVAHSPPPAPAPSPASFSAHEDPPAPPAIEAPSPAPAPARSVLEAQLPGIGLEDLEELSLPTPAPPFVAPDAAAQPPAPTDQQQQQEQDEKEQGREPHGKEQQAAEPEVKVSLMGRGVWKSHQKVSYPTDPEVPPAFNNISPGSFCNPQLGLEPTDDGRCVCMQGFGTNADMRTCSKCPVGWYSRGGQVGIVFCKPCPQLSTSNPSRTACVARRNVIRPDIAKSMCEFCRIPTQPFSPPTCCPRGQVCCGDQGCCPTKRCINNATTNFQPRCCGDDCNTGQILNCCPAAKICVNITGSQTQSCCAAGNVCGDASTKSCCNTDQSCCGNRDCCNTATNANPKQTCANNNITGPPQNDQRCCLETQINCNGTCCTTLDSPASQRCLVDANGQALCCNVLQLCQSQADGVNQCCSAAGSTCTRNLTSTGQVVARCCPAGFSLCPKNSFPPICCVAGKCPSPSTAENCLA